MRPDADATGGSAARRAVLTALIVAIACLIALSAAAAEESPSPLDGAGVDALLDQAAELGGANVRALMERALSGEAIIDMEDIRSRLRAFASATRDGLVDALRMLSTPVLACLVLRALTGGRDIDRALTLVCRLSCAALLMERFAECRSVAEGALKTSVRLVGAAAPVLATALTLTGCEAQAVVLTPSAALCADLIDGAFLEIGLPLCAVAAAVAAAANLSERFHLNRLFELLHRGIKWGVRASMAGFVAMLAIQGLLATGQDAIAGRAVRRAIQSAVPIIGGSASDSAGALLSSAMAVRGAAGVAGMLALIAACAMPVARLMAASLALRLASAVLEPVSDAGVARIVGHFADLNRTLVALCAGGAMLGALALGACLGFSYIL